LPPGKEPICKAATVETGITITPENGVAHSPASLDHE
jgi:hypothetical protein